MADNRFIAAPAQVTIGTKHTQNTTGTPFKNNSYKEECGEIVDDEEDDDQDKWGDKVDILSTSYPAQVTIGARNKQNNTDTPFNKKWDK